MLNKPLYLISTVLAIGILGFGTYIIIKNRKAKKNNKK
tara:strand:+ start:3805 stop:3918 length:114 start_codon:yes stop_codon:yes gene_type:complete